MKNEMIHLSSPIEQPKVYTMPPGFSLLELASFVPDIDYDRFLEEGIIEVDGEFVPRDWWADWVPSDKELVRFHQIHAGGGGDKNILATIASVLVAVAAFSVSGGALAPYLGSGFAKGTIGAALASTAIAVVGQLAIGALFPPALSGAPGLDSPDSPEQAKNASIQGNLLGKGERIARVVGTFVFAPSLIVQPRAYVQEEDVMVEAIYACAGPTDFEDITVQGIPIGDMGGVEYWVDQGLPNTQRDNHFDRYASSDQLGLTMTRHSVASGETQVSDNQLSNQDNPDKSLPSWHRMSCKKEVSYFSVMMTLGGLYDPTEISGLTNHVVWFRIRGRKRGDTAWKNLVTIPYRSRTNNVLKREIRFFFQSQPLAGETQPQRINGFLEPNSPPAVSEDHVNIVPADGEQFPPSITVNTYLRPEGVDLYLDDPYFQTGDEFEFEIKRSEMVKESILSDVRLMQKGGSTYDFFDARLRLGAWSTESDVGNFSDSIGINIVSSITKRPPVPRDAPLSTLHVRVRNVDLSDLKIKGSGLAPVNGGAYGVTSNPADHFRYLLQGPLSVDKIPDDEMDLDVINAWRNECITQGYEVNGLLKGNIGDSLNAVCAAGHALYNEGFKYGVVYNRDTTTEPAVQHFTPINTSKLSWSKAFTKKPNALRAEFYSRAEGHELDEMEISNPEAVGYYPYRSETIRYPLVDTEDQIRKRVELDFKQLNNSLRYSFEMGLAGLAVSRGQIGLLSSRFLHRATTWGRVIEVINSTVLRVDNAPDTVGVGGNFFDTANVFDLNDIFLEGVEFALSVELSASEGTQVSLIETYDPVTGQITVDSTVDIRVGDVCTIGPSGLTTKRVMVTSIIPKDQHSASVTVMEEMI